MKKIVDLSKLPTKSKSVLDSINKRMQQEKGEKKEGLNLKVFVKDLVERKFKGKEDDNKEEETL